MINLRLYLLISSIIYTGSLSAGIVQVVKLQGHATYLSSGMRAAKEVTLNQWLDKDTSILTSDKSFLILKYMTGSAMTLGPNSKIVVDSGLNKDQQVVNLLIGKIKATIKNIHNTNENKMLIKTNSAALGIRGTVFQAGYNPETKMTSLLTFHGAVAMTKTVNTNPTVTADLTKLQDKLKEDSVLVKVGEYSGISETTDTITTPVKIAPDQFTKLQLNQSLGATEEKIAEKVYTEELEKNEKLFASNKTITTDSNAKDKLDLRSGGFIDGKTGVYVPPPKNSEFDKNLNIYRVDEKMGKTNDNGDYIPPAGLKFDPKNGFIVEKENSNTETTALAKELNEEIVKQFDKTEAVIIKKKKTLDNMNDDVYKKYYEPVKI